MAQNSRTRGVDKVVWLIGIIAAIWALRYASVVHIPRSEGAVATTWKVE